MTQGTEGSTQVQKAPVKASGGLDFWLGASLSWYSLETGIRQSCAWGGWCPKASSAKPPVWCYFPRGDLS